MVCKIIIQYGDLDTEDIKDEWWIEEKDKCLLFGIKQLLENIAGSYFSEPRDDRSSKTLRP